MGHSLLGLSWSQILIAAPLDTVSTTLAETQRLGSAESHQPWDNLPCRL